MRFLSLTTCLAIAVLVVPANAQLHGTHEVVERSREPGIRPNTLEEVFAGALEQAHNSEGWHKHDAATFQMQLRLGEADPLPIEATFATRSRAFVLRVDDKPIYGHNGKEAWLAEPELDADVAMHLRMLAQLPAMAYRMRADDRIVHSGPMRTVNDRRYYATTYEPTEGDDWSILLVTPHNNLLHIVAYFIRTDEKQDPSFSPAYAMVAGEYEKTDEVPFARTWELWRWSRPRGLVGDEPIGKVTVNSVSFIKLQDGMFNKPDEDDNDDT